MKCSNLPNYLTWSRIIMIPFIALLLCFDAIWAGWAVFSLYILVAATDWLDGFLARRLNVISDMGRFLDPIADKLLVVTLLVMLVQLQRLESMTVIAVIAILLREIAVSGLREYLGPKGIIIHVSKLAKWKTASQMTALALLLLEPAKLDWKPEVIGEVVLWLAAILTVFTGWDYLTKGFKSLSKLAEKLPETETESESESETDIVESGEAVASPIESGS